MNRNKWITPEGTRDLLFEECEARRTVERILSKVFSGRGFTEVVTPGLEFLDLYDLKAGSMPVERMYKLTDSKGRLIVMRPDSTIPIARLVSTRLKGCQLPIRLFYNQSVFTSNPGLKGRSDEIVQTGIEIIGSDSRRADLEVMTTAVEALGACNVSDFRLEIGHIGLFHSLISSLRLGEEEQEEIRLLIEGKNYPALNDYLDEICANGGDRRTVEVLKQLPRLFGGEEVFDKAANLFDDAKTEYILSYLRSIYHDLAALGMKEKISVDLGIVNRNDYYTGVVFRGYIEGFGETVLSGGRYDTLLSEFGADLPATGFGVNVDAVARSLLKSSGTAARVPDVLVFGADGYEMKALLHAKALIDSGLVAEYCVLNTAEKAKEYAAAKQIPRVDIVGEETESFSGKERP